MTNQHKWMTAILLVIIVALAWLWIDARNERDQILARLENASADSTEEIKEKCNPLTLNDPGKREECKEALSDFGAQLAEYQKKVAEADAKNQ